MSNEVKEAGAVAHAGHAEFAAYFAMRIARLRLYLPYSPASMGNMLVIATNCLPRSVLAYTAFRVAFHETLERIVLSQQVDEPVEGFGYLTEVPFLKSVPPQVQLELIASIWHRHMAAEPFEADLVDESVIYAACETAARLIESRPLDISHWLANGPMRVPVEVNQTLAEGLRTLHINLPSEGDFLLISQFEDMPPNDAVRAKRKFGMDPQRLECLFGLLGRWHSKEGFAERLNGLFEVREIARIHSILNLE